MPDGKVGRGYWRKTNKKRVEPKGTFSTYDERKLATGGEGKSKKTGTGGKVRAQVGTVGGEFYRKNKKTGKEENKR